MARSRGNWNNESEKKRFISNPSSSSSASSNSSSSTNPKRKMARRDLPETIVPFTAQTSVHEQKAVMNQKTNTGTESAFSFERKTSVSSSNSFTLSHDTDIVQTKSKKRGTLAYYLTMII